MTWTTGTINTADAWSGIAYGNNRFVTVANASANSSYSTDGITWIQGTKYPPNATRIFNGVLPVNCYWQDVGYNGNHFFAVAVGAYGATSLDGSRWSFSSLPYNKQWQGVASGAGYSLVVGSGFTTKFGFPYGNRSVAVSPDPHNWSSSAMDASLPWTAVAYGNGQFVAITSNGVASSCSTHGASWITSNNLPASQSWTSITYGGNRFVAIASNSAVAAYSTDGTHWTATTLPAASNWTSIAYGNGTFVTVANNGANAAVSSDGVSWHVEAMPSTQNWTAVTYGFNRFVAVAANTTITAIRL
jgi:hypothetical protein